jgi:hypothetical protein
MNSFFYDLMLRTPPKWNPSFSERMHGTFKRKRPRGFQHDLITPRQKQDEEEENNRRSLLLGARAWASLYRYFDHDCGVLAMQGPFEHEKMLWKGIMVLLNIRNEEKKKGPRKWNCVHVGKQYQRLSVRHSAGNHFCFFSSSFQPPICNDRIVREKFAGRKKIVVSVPEGFCLPSRAPPELDTRLLNLVVHHHPGCSLLLAPRSSLMLPDFLEKPNKNVKSCPLATVKRC